MGVGCSTCMFCGGGIFSYLAQLGMLCEWGWDILLPVCSVGVGYSPTCMFCGGGVFSYLYVLWGWGILLPVCSVGWDILLPVCSVGVGYSPTCMFCGGGVFSYLYVLWGWDIILPVCSVGVGHSPTCMFCGGGVFSVSHDTTLLGPESGHCPACTVESRRAFSIALRAEFIMATVDMGVFLNENKIAHCSTGQCK